MVILNYSAILLCHKTNIFLSQIGLPEMFFNFVARNLNVSKQQIHEIKFI